MQTCPQCQQAVKETAIVCPHCRTELKAFGHPGIDLHRTRGDRYLCETCAYLADDSCTFPQRPYAKECTMYWHVDEPFQEEKPRYQPPWYARIPTSALFLGLLAFCFLVVWLR